MENNSYVYQHINKTTGEIFYIGIGTKNKNGKLRAYSRSNRNRIWHNYIKKHGDFIVEFIKTNITRSEACEIETKLIKEYGRIIDGSGRLTNISFGGEKTFYGMIRTKEHTQKIINKITGRKASLETRKKQSEKRLGIKLTQEHKEKIGLGNRGKIISEETKRKISLAQKGNKNRVWNDMEREKQRIALKGINAKMIKCLNNNIIYSSMIEAGNNLGISSKHISSVCKGKRTHTFGYKFIYI